MSKKGDKEKSGAKILNVEVAPGNRTRLEAYIHGYNTRPDRKTPKIKYTDVLNEAVDRFLDARLDALRAKLRLGKK